MGEPQQPGNRVVQECLQRQVQTLPRHEPRCRPYHREALYEASSPLSAAGLPASLPRRGHHRICFSRDEPILRSRTAGREKGRGTQNLGSYRGLLWESKGCGPSKSHGKIRCPRPRSRPSPEEAVSPPGSLQRRKRALRHLTNPGSLCGPD